MYTHRDSAVCLGSIRGRDLGHGQGAPPAACRATEACCARTRRRGLSSGGQGGRVPGRPTDMSVPSGTPDVEHQAQLSPALSPSLLLGTEEPFGFGEGKKNSSESSFC